METQRKNLEQMNLMVREATESLKRIVAKVKVWERLLQVSDAAKNDDVGAAMAHGRARQNSHPGALTPTTLLRSRARTASDCDYTANKMHDIIQGSSQITNVTDLPVTCNDQQPLSSPTTESSSSSFVAAPLPSLTTNLTNNSKTMAPLVFAFHPAAPLEVHSVLSTGNGVTQSDLSFCVRLRWRHSEPNLIWTQRENVQYLVYGQAMYDTAHPKATLLDHFDLMAVVDCCGKYITNGGRTPVCRARDYSEVEVCGGFTETVIFGLQPNMQYEFVIACRNILLEDCGVQSYPVAQARTNNLVVGEEGLSTPLCEFFDVIQILHKQSNGERDRYHLSSEHMQNSKRKEEASHNNNHEKVVCNPRHKIKNDEPVVYNGFGSAFHAQIMRGVHARNYRNKACQRLVQLVLGSRAQNFLFPRTRSNLKKTAWQMPEPNIAATNSSLAAGVNVQNNYSVLSDELVVAFLCDQLKMHQFCVSFPSTGRIDLLRSCVGQDEVNYQGFREHLESHYRQTLASFRRRLGQIDNERMKQLRRFEADSELDRLALATEALKKQRQTIQIQDPELAQHLNKPSAKVGVGLHALDGSKFNTKDNDHGSAFSTNSKIFQIQKQKIGHNTQNSSADGVHLGWKMWAPVENYDPWIDAQGFSRPDQAVKKKRLRAKTKPIKFKHVVRCFMWSFDAAFENKISSMSERESEPPRKMPIVAKTRKGIVSDAAHMEFQNTTKKRITLQNSNLYKLDNIHKVELLQHKAALHQSLPSCDCLLSVDLDTKRSRSSYLSVSPDTGGTSTADAASKIDPRIAKHRLCYAITIELVEKCKELGASHDDEEAEHPYDRILWLQRRRARCEATRSVTLLHVSRAAIADMWNVLRQGLPSKIPCEVLPMF
jgi:hypothetical protein